MSIALIEAAGIGFSGIGLVYLALRALITRSSCGAGTAIALGATGLLAIGWAGAHMLPAVEAAMPVLQALQVVFFALVGVTVFLFAAEVAVDQRRLLEASLRGEKAKAMALDEKERLYRTVVNGTPLILFAVSSDRRIHLAEGLGLQLVGVEPGAQVGRTIDDVLADYPQAREVLSKALHGEPQQINFPFGGRIFDATLSPLRDVAGRVTQVLGLAVDVTERVRKETAEREALRNRLEVERLKEVDAFKTRLLNTASHELNTPITPLMLQLHVLRAATSETADAHQRKAIDVLDRNVRRLADLVKDILEVARLQSGTFKVDAHATELAPLINDVEETYLPQAERKEVALEVDVPEDLHVLADAGRLHQVLSNLVTNALKFTPNGGRIDIRARVQGDKVLVEVQDTGAGLAPDQVVRLFEPFSQVHDPQVHNVGGTGLGLYICKGIVEETGGTIGVDSDGPGKGSVFWFTLPVAPAPVVQVQ